METKELTYITIDQSINLLSKALTSINVTFDSAQSKNGFLLDVVDQYKIELNKANIYTNIQQPQTNNDF